MSVDRKRIAGAYPTALARLYAAIRFLIIRDGMLDEIDRRMPKQGRILDVGCGFGLFSMHFAMTGPGRALSGFDLNAGRIAAAQTAAANIGLSNATFSVLDATKAPITEPFDAIYMIDLLHHLSPAAVPPLLAAARKHLSQDGMLLVKDIADRPAYKRWFTWLLDKAMDYKTPVHYWNRSAMQAEIERHGFKVTTYDLPDILPYPHVLYVCRCS